MIVGIDDVQIAVPPGCEPQARAARCIYVDDPFGNRRELPVRER